MSSIENVVAEVVADYRQYTDSFKEERADEVEGLTMAIDEIGYDRLSDYFLDLMDELRDDLAPKAANQFESNDDQEAAISAIEGWVSDNVSSQGTHEAVLAAFYLKGISKSDAILEEIRAAVPQTGSQL
jgi:hypothetical protein